MERSPKRDCEPVVRRFCMNCDNRHGCKTPEPPCLKLSLDPAERYLSGKEILAGRGLLDLCRRCGHFRNCWGAEEYRKATSG